MSVLKLKQTTKTGKVKVFKVDSKSTLKTFGTSRKANLISIDADSAPFEGSFEHRADGWHYITFDVKTLKPDTKIENGTKVQLKSSELHFEVAEIKEHLYEDFNHLNSTGSVEKQIYIVSRNNRILETKITNKNEGFNFAIHGKKNLFKLNPSTSWVTEIVEGFEIKSKLIQVDALENIKKSSSQGLTPGEKKTVSITLGFFGLLVFVALLAPKQEPMAVVEPPKTEVPVIVKLDKKKMQQPKKAQQAQAAPAEEKKQASGAPAGGSKVSAMLKGAVGVRISQLIGKVSATEARTANVLVTSAGVKAGEASGRALAAVGKVESSGRNWNGESAGKGTGVSTAGVGGGNGTKGLGGGLGQGKTGSGGVGLIEEESEVVGGLDREIIAQYIKTQLGQILYCYERQLSANPDLYGKVAVKFTISGTGQVATQAISDTTLKSAPVEGCILNKVAKWKFPEPKGGTQVLVTYPFLFKSTN